MHPTNGATPPIFLPRILMTRRLRHATAISTLPALLRGISIARRRHGKQEAAVRPPESAGTANAMQTPPPARKSRRIAARHDGSLPKMATLMAPQMCPARRMRRRMQPLRRRCSGRKRKRPCAPRRPSKLLVPPRRNPVNFHLPLRKKERHNKAPLRTLLPLRMRPHRAPDDTRAAVQLVWWV